MFYDNIDWKSLKTIANNLLKELFPICRSITGDGVRKSLSILKEISDFNLFEIPTGTQCYDWTIPQEWSIKSAYIKDQDGNIIVDFDNSNLHVVNYSQPIDKIITYDELAKHIHTLKNLPDAIPYRTTYYNSDWGFCMSYNKFKNLDKSKKYYVKIDSNLKTGSLTYGEKFITGKTDNTYLLSTYCCHPSLANDNLSGMVLWTLLLKILSEFQTNNSYKFVIAPETIGVIAYLNQNETEIKKVNGGFVITTVAGKGKFGYKNSFLENSIIDRVVKKTFQELNQKYIHYDFDIYGSDETHYSAPFFRIPIGTICKDKYYEYDYYHTSYDNLDYISAESLIETLKLYILSIEKLEMNFKYKSLIPYCEPMFGKRNLYPKIGGQIKQSVAEGNDYDINEMDCMLWLMFYCDGEHDILSISEKTNLPVNHLYRVAEKLHEHKLLKKMR